MPRFAFTLSDEQKNWIESKATENDLSQGEVVRRVIKSAMNDTDTDSLIDTDWLSDTQTDTPTVSQDEFEQLQERVSQLEASMSDPDHDNQDSSSTTTEATNSTDDSIVTVDDAESDTLKEFVTAQTEWTDSRRDEVINARVTALQYLQNVANGKDERVPTRRLFEVCQDRDATVTNQTVDPEASNLNQSVFYEKTLKPILDDASDAGIISRLQGGDYGWYWDS
jgi:hypothetical protein